SDTLSPSRITVPNFGCATATELVSVTMAIASFMDTGGSYARTFASRRQILGRAGDLQHAELDFDRAHELVHVRRQPIADATWLERLHGGCLRHERVEVRDLAEHAVREVVAVRRHDVVGRALHDERRLTALADQRAERGERRLEARVAV